MVASLICTDDWLKNSASHIYSISHVILYITQLFCLFACPCTDTKATGGCVKVLMQRSRDRSPRSCVIELHEASQVSNWGRKYHRTDWFCILRIVMEYSTAERRIQQVGSLTLVFGICPVSVLFSICKFVVFVFFWWLPGIYRLICTESNWVEWMIEFNN